jgi:hypothetical protein
MRADLVAPGRGATMKRAHVISLMALAVAVPAATAGSFFASSASPAKPCFASGAAAYELSGSADADYTVRIDNAAANPSVRMQLVDDPAAADFVMVDDGDATQACTGASSLKTVRVDPAALAPDLTVTLSRADADYKVYVRSAAFSEQDAAALFAVIWQNTRRTGAARQIAARQVAARP